MKSQKDPRWWLLAVIVLLGCAGLAEEVRLPLSPAIDSWALGVWVVFFYGAIVLWLMVNRDRLEQPSRTSRFDTRQWRAQELDREERQDD